ncbi:MAG TPA: glycine cleavage system protein H, partial [Spirochaetia bacterium]|nr:glycine cleavage system protein H [Spirochaetia bacterium]
MTNPKDLKYTKEHEWVRIKGKVAYVGITDHAQDELGDIVYVEMPEVGRVVVQGEETSNIESVKAAAPVYAPVSGTIT